MPRAEFISAWPDGSGFIASRLGVRATTPGMYPKYGVLGYAPLDALNDFERPWSHGGHRFDLPMRARRIRVPTLCIRRIGRDARHAAARQRSASRMPTGTPHRPGPPGMTCPARMCGEVRLIADSARVAAPHLLTSTTVRWRRFRTAAPAQGGQTGRW